MSFILKTLTLVDTCEFQRWAEETYAMSSDEWYKKIWRLLSDYMMDGPYTTFNKTENPENLLEEHINEFLDDCSQLNGEVSFIFTN